MRRAQLSWVTVTLLLCSGSSAAYGCSADVTQTAPGAMNGSDTRSPSLDASSSNVSNSYVHAAIADARVAGLASALGLAFDADATQVRDLRTSAPSNVPGVEAATLQTATQAAPIGVSFRGRTRDGKLPAVLNVALSADTSEVFVAAAKVGAGEQAAMYVPGENGAVRVGNEDELRAALANDAARGDTCTRAAEPSGAAPGSHVGSSACALGWVSWVGIAAGIVLVLGVLFGLPADQPAYPVAGSAAYPT